MTSLNGGILVVKTLEDLTMTVVPVNPKWSRTVVETDTTCAGSAQDSRNQMKHRPPFHKIVRRLIALPFLFVGMVIMFLAILIGFGYQEAVRFWRNG
jgi:hypothetical protein